jgi:ABC-type nitrate/sulfonate/bicarbonate transport system permease component
VREGISARALLPSMRPLSARVAPPLLFAVAVLGVWQLYATVSGIGEAVLPKPTQVASAWWEIRSLLLANGWTTLEEILLGYLAAVTIGVALAVLVNASRLAGRAIYPWLVVSQTVPIPVLAPIFVIWTGFDVRPKLITVALTTFFPIVVNTIDGLRSADPEMLDLLKTMGAGRRRRFRVVQLPSALPFLFSGMKVAAALSVIGVVFAELVGSTSGLGFLILSYGNQLATPQVFATVVTLSAMGILLFFTVAGLERLALPWYHAARRPD